MTAVGKVLHIRGQQKLRLLTTRLSWVTFTSQKPPPIHCPSLNVWTLYFSLPAVWVPATQPLSLALGPNSDDISNGSQQRRAYDPDDSLRGLSLLRLTSAPGITICWAESKEERRNGIRGRKKGEVYMKNSVMRLWTRNCLGFNK